MIALSLIMFNVQCTMLKAQNISDGSWWFDGYSNYGMSISGQFVNMFGERGDGEAIQGLLKRITKTRYTVLPIGEGFSDVPFRTKSGCSAEHVVYGGKEYLVVKNMDGNAVWTLTKHNHSYNLKTLLALEEEYESRPVEDLLDSFMMNTTYLSRFSKKELNNIRFALQHRLMSGEGLSVIGQTNLQLVMSELQLSDYMRHGVKVPDIEGKLYGQQIVVHNAQEFFDALGSDREIIIDEDVVINITEGLNDPDFGSKPNRLVVGVVSDEVDADTETIISEGVFDGRQLVLNGMKHLAIRGRKGSVLLAEPRYSFVLSLRACEDVVIDNLILGHTFEGYCDGGVINLNSSKHVVINRCDLFGCGTYGLCAREAEHVTLMNSFIRHCTYGITDLHNNKHLLFYNCDIFSNKEFSLFNSIDTDELIIDSCRFFANWPNAPLFFMNHPVTMGDSYIMHPMQTWGDAELIETGRMPNKWFDGNYSYPKFRGVGPEGITKWEDLLVPEHKE